MCRSAGAAARGTDHRRDPRDAHVVMRAAHPLVWELVNLSTRSVHTPLNVGTICALGFFTYHYNTHTFALNIYFLQLSSLCIKFIHDIMSGTKNSE